MRCSAASGASATRSAPASTCPAPPCRRWLWTRWVAAYGEEAAARIAAANLEEPALDLTVKADPGSWAGRLDGIVLPTGSVRLVPSGPVEDLPGYAEGAWWVQDAAAALPAAPLPRHRRQACRRPLRRARRQDRGAGRRPAPTSPPSTSRSSGSGASPPTSRASASPPRSSPPTSSRGPRRSRSTRSSSMRPAPRPAPSAATPTSPGSSGPRTWRSLADLQGRMIDRAVAWLKPGGRARLLDLLARARGGRAPDGPRPPPPRPRDSARRAGRDWWNCRGRPALRRGADPAVPDARAHAAIVGP